MPRPNTNPLPPSAIEKTRQPAAPKEPAAFPPQVGPPRGVLHSTDPRGDAFFHQRLAPPAELATFVQHFWFVQWNLENAAPSEAETLPHPSCYLVFEHDLLMPSNSPLVHQRAEVSGVTTGKFTRTMQGSGRVFGLKFRPGGLRPFLDSSVATLTDRIVPAAQIFGEAILPLATQLRVLDTPEQMAEATSAFLSTRSPAPDPSATLAASIVDIILNDASLLTVEQLADRVNLSVRSLQRLFQQYVGVAPKWVIRRYRLHELVERLHSGQPLDFAQLALELGYADQAHLIRDFRDLAGYTPSGYRRRALASR